MRLALERLENRLVPSTFYVDSLGDTGQGMTNEGDLRYCINQIDKSTDASNTIVFPGQVSGTIQLNSELPHISKNVTISGNTNSPVTIHGNGTTQNPYNIFTVDKGVTAEIDNLTITGGYTNSSGVGGAGVANNGNLTLIGDTIENNTASGDPGGGISNGIGAQLNLQNVFIYLNDADSGGGIANWGSVTICCGSQIFSNNATAAMGGGIYNAAGGTMELFDNTQIYGNTSTWGGGGIYNSGTFIMHGGSVSNNSVGAGENGGGLYNNGGGNMTLDQGVVVEKNQADEGGGLYLATKSTTTVNTVTIQNNTLQLGGKGVGYYKQLDPVNPQNDAVLNQTALNNPDGFDQGS